MRSVTYRAGRARALVLLRCVLEQDAQLSLHKWGTGELVSKVTLQWKLASCHTGEKREGEVEIFLLRTKATVEER